MERRIIDKRKKEKFMVDDEYLNGQAKLCGISATGVYMVLCRHANQGQECFPSNIMIAEKLGLSVRTVVTAIQTLENRRVISVGKMRKKDGKWLNNLYTLLDKSEWVYDQVQPLHMDEPCANNDTSQVQITTDSQVQPLHTKETHKYQGNKCEGNTLSEQSSQKQKDISEVIKMFEIINPSYEKFYGNTTQRSACERLLKKWSIPQIRVLVNLLPEFNAGEYQKGKSITPLQFEDNLAYIKTYIDSKRKVNSKITIIS